MRNFTPDDPLTPLPGPAVTNLFQDQQGLIWMCVYGNGVTKYDGSQVQVIQTPSALCGQPQQVAQDSMGRLWVLGTKGAVVTELPLQDYAPGDSLAFTDTLLGVPLPKGKTDLHQNILTDQRGNLWLPLVGDQYSLVYVRYETPESLTLDSLHNPGNKGSAFINNLTQRADGKMWTLPFMPGFLAFSLDSLHNRDTVPFNLSRKEEGMLRGMNVHALLEDKEGNLWIGREDGMISVWWKGKPQPEPWVPVFGSEALTDMIVGRDGTIYVSGAFGVGLIQPSQFPKVQLITENEGLPATYSFALQEDQEGNIWVATLAGVARLSGDFRAFGGYTDKVAEGKSPILLDNGINTLLTDVIWKVGSRVDTLLLAGHTKGVDVIGINDKRITSLGQAQGLTSDVIISLGQDQSGRIWIGTQKGLNCLAPLDAPLPNNLGQVQRISFLNQPALLYTFQIGMITAVSPLSIPTPPGQQGSQEIMAFPAGNGVYVIVDDYMLGLGQDIGLEGNGYNKAVCDQQGYMYILGNEGIFRSTSPFDERLLDSLRTNGKQLDISGFRYSYRVVTPNLFTHLDMVIEGDTAKEITSILPFEGEFWIGSEHGVMIYDPGTQQIRARIEGAEELSLGQSLRYDARTGWIWLFKKRGLAAIDPNSLSIVKRVSKQDGLMATRLWGPENLQIGANGRIYLGTNVGISLYRPKLDLPQPPLPEVIFTDVNRVSRAEGIQEIRFDYTALAYFWENALQYRYRLVGYEEDWNPPTQELNVRYTNLPAFLFSRSYTFEVEAGELQGKWSKKIARYTFSVAPPIYLSWWAVALYAALAITAIWLLVRGRINAQQREIERQQEANARMRQIDKLKDQFLANTSHELRTPLNGIIGITEALLEDAENEEERQNLGMVVASGKRLASLVNDLLDFSKLRHSELVLRQKPVDLRSVVEVVMQLSSPMVKGKEVRLINDIATDLSSAYVDEDRISQVFFNLVGNALKFTDQGYVKVEAKEQGDHLQLAVVDTGIGIPADKQQVIFEVFEQADGSISREYEGTGLGLSISKTLIEQHGGEMWVESEEGKGSSFFFTVPLSKERAKQEADISASILNSLTAISSRETLTFEPSVSPLGLTSQQIRILIVDDEPINHQVLSNHLRGQEYAVFVAMNGEEALQMIEEGGQFDLVLLDVMMPRMSGYEVCKKIRQYYLPNELPIIMVTAKNQVYDLVQGLNIGANDYLAKPFSKDEFLARLQTHVNLYHINRATHRFVPSEFIQALGYTSIMDVQLGDHTQQEVTVFFSDIRNYTSMAERMNPEENFTFVSNYSRRMGPIIKENQGFVNQYLGDGIMALFKQSPSDAFQAGIRMQAELRRFNEERMQKGRTAIHVGMGFHTGPLVMGIIGDQDRSDPAIISDTVNTASRLEGLTKYYGANILLSETSYQRLSLSQQQHCRFLGKVKVKGKEKPIGIYEALEGDNEQSHQQKRETLEQFNAAIEAYQTKDFQAAITRFQTVVSQHSEDQVAQGFLYRLQEGKSMESEA